MNQKQLDTGKLALALQDAWDTTDSLPPIIFSDGELLVLLNAVLAALQQDWVFRDREVAEARTAKMKVFYERKRAAEAR